jgi:hypothetical protein
MPQNPPVHAAPPPAASQAQITLEGLYRWGPWLASFLLFVITVTAATVLIYAVTKNDLANMRTEIAETKAVLADFQANGTPRARELSREVAELRQGRERDDTERRELLKRMGNVEKFLARIVCKQDPRSCTEAMALIGQ